MNLTKKQFDILAVLAENGGSMKQRQLQTETGYSLGTINSTIKELAEAEMVADGEIKPKGLKALEPFKVKRAIFLAAGLGSRLLPVTLNTPKPLVRVKGKRIIDGLIDACLAAEIEDIIIVRGCFSEQFDQLLYKYPMVRFLENTDFNESNNVVSALCARYLLSNAYVFESDLIIHKPELIKKYHYCSDFLGFKTERSDDWCFSVKNGYIDDEMYGGLNCYQMVGISYWDEQSGRKLAEHLRQAVDMPGGREHFWEEVPLKVFKGEYRVQIQECAASDITEIDTFRELKAADPAYELYR